MRKLLKKQGFAPEVLVTDKLGSYGAAKAEIGLLATSGACARTIGPRIRINRHDDASARCNASNRPDQPSASSRFTPRSSTPSTSSAISHSATRRSIPDMGSRYRCLSPSWDPQIAHGQFKFV